MPNNSYATDPAYREKQRERARRWYYENRDHVLGNRPSGDERKRILAQRQSDQTKHWKAMAYARLGSVCAICGFADERALQLDHIDAGGQKIRKASRTRSYLSYYRDIALSPEGIEKHIQVLCCNCNSIKRFTVDQGDRVA